MIHFCFVIFSCSLDPIQVDDGDAYDNHEVIWRYPKLRITWMNSSANSHDWAFQGMDRSGLRFVF